MTKALTSIGSAAAAIAAVAVLDRLLPALAAGLVAMAHELHAASALNEAARRARR